MQTYIVDTDTTGFIKQAAVKDGNDIYSYVGISKPFELAVTMGMVEGYSTIDKFGLNPLITTTTDPEDIWEGGGTYIYDADGTAPIVSLASSGADVQPITIEGLDIDGNFIEQTITLTGTTRAALTTPLWRVYRMSNAGNVSLIGTVYCYTGTGTVPTTGDPEVRAIIDNGNNQTLMSLYTIPKGKVGFLYRGELGIEYENVPGADAHFMRCIYQSRRYGKVFTIKKSITLLTLGTAVFQDRRSFPDIIPALTDIKLTAKIVSENMGAWGTFDIMLVDETNFTPEFLTAIGQP